MPSPPIQVFLTTIASQPALRQRQEYILRILQGKRIPFTSYDLASDESAKKLWRRKAPRDKQQLPGILVGGQFPGVFTEFEDAVEHDELDMFLRLKEEWDDDEDHPVLPETPIGVPGASLPLSMTPERLRAKVEAGMRSVSASASSPLAKKIVPVNKRTDEFDVGDELAGFGLQGVRVTEDELRDLVAELGLDGDDAGDLVKGLSFGDAPEPQPRSAPLVPKETVEVAAEVAEKISIDNGKALGMAKVINTEETETDSPQQSSEDSEDSKPDEGSSDTTTPSVSDSKKSLSEKIQPIESKEQENVSV